MRQPSARVRMLVILDIPIYLFFVLYHSLSSFGIDKIKFQEWPVKIASSCLEKDKQFCKKIWTNRRHWNTFRRENNKYFILQMFGFPLLIHLRFSKIKKFLCRKFLVQVVLTLTDYLRNVWCTESKITMTYRLSGVFSFTFVFWSHSYAIVELNLR